MNALKIVGTRDAAATPAESLRTLHQLQQLALKTGAWKPARGFVVKGRTHEEAERLWKAKVAEMGQEK